MLDLVTPRLEVLAVLTDDGDPLGSEPAVAAVDEVDEVAPPQPAKPTTTAPTTAKVRNREVWRRVPCTGDLIDVPSLLQPFTPPARIAPPVVPAACR